jgi:integrase
MFSLINTREPRYMSAHDLTSKKARDRLPVRATPYWARLSPGTSLGFVRGPDTWRIRYRLPGRHQYTYQAIGSHDEYEAAKRAALAWLAQYTGTRVASDDDAPKRGASVRDALNAYLKHLRSDTVKRADTAEDAEWRYEGIVFSDPFADLMLDKLRPVDVERWRARHTAGRTARTLNRYVRAVVAGLNTAHKRLGYLADPTVWKVESLPDDGDEAAPVFLSPAQRKELLKHGHGGLVAFLRAIEMTGGRPKEIAQAKVHELAPDVVKLWHRKGRPAKLRSRYVILTPEARAFFAAQAAGKARDALIMIQENGKRWTRHQWSRYFRAAVKRANDANKANPELLIPIEASAYSFRHARISELLQVYGIDPVTVAAQTGTSVAMIEKYYHRFIPDAMLKKLATITEKESAE